MEKLTTIEDQMEELIQKVDNLDAKKKGAISTPDEVAILILSSEQSMGGTATEYFVYF